MHTFTPILPNSERAKSAIVLLYLVIGFSFITAITSLYIAIENRNTYGVDHQLLSYVTLCNIITHAIRFFIILAAAILFILWMSRAYYNLDRTRMVQLDKLPGMAAGAWFIPFVNLWWPRDIMREIWNKTQDLFHRTDIPRPERMRDDFISRWWFYLIIMEFFSFLANWFFRTRDFDKSAFVAMLSSIASIVAGFLAIKIIRSVRTMEEEMTERAAAFYNWRTQLEGAKFRGEDLTWYYWHDPYIVRESLAQQAAETSSGTEETDDRAE